MPSGRFKDNDNYLPRFFTPSNFAAVDAIRCEIDKHDMTMIEATYRWLLCDSALTAHDGVLIGASTHDHLTSNLAACDKARKEGGLPEPVREVS